MPAMGTLIKPGGTPELVYAKSDKWTLEELQVLVGGYIELATRVKTIDMKPLDFIVNEDGLNLGLPVNDLASHIADQQIVGNMLMILREDWE